MRVVDFNVLGPFGWPRYEGSSPVLPKLPGVYLQTMAHNGGFLPFGVGITRNPMRTRFLAHSREYLRGKYNILSPEGAASGVREVLWKGWQWSDEKQAAFDARREEIIAMAERQLAASQIFIIDTGVTPRILDRIEGALVNHFYKDSASLIDRGMFRSTCWPQEEPLLARFATSSTLHGLPAELEI